MRGVGDPEVWWVILPPARCYVVRPPWTRWAERPVWLSGGGPAGVVAAAATLAGTVIAAAGFAILTTHAFPVPGEVVFMPAIGVACVLVAAALLRVDPIAPLHAHAEGRSVACLKVEAVASAMFRARAPACSTYWN